MNIDITKLTVREVMEEFAKLPITHRDLLKLNDIKLFEELFTLTGGTISIKTRGKNKGKPKYEAPRGYKYDRDDLYPILIGMTRKELISIDTILRSEFFFRDDTDDTRTKTEKLRKKYYRWYWSNVPFKITEKEKELIWKSEIWRTEYLNLCMAASLVKLEDGYFEIDDYNKYHFELQPQIDIEKDLLKQKC